MDAHLNFVNQVNMINHINEMTRFMDESVRNHRNCHGSNNTNGNYAFEDEFEKRKKEFEAEFEKRKQEIAAAEAEILKFHAEFNRHHPRFF